MKAKPKVNVIRSCIVEIYRMQVKWIGILSGYRAMQSKIGKYLVRRCIGEYRNREFTLDLGCGNSPTHEYFPNRIGVDIVLGAGVDVICDAHYLPFPANMFPQIVCSEVLEHLRDSKMAVSEIARVLKKDGILILTVPFNYPVHEAPYDFYRFTPYGLHELFQRDFEIQRLDPIFTEEQTIGVLLQRIVFQSSMGLIRKYCYLLAANIFFRLGSLRKGKCYQNISRSIEGSFLTAGYLLIAKRR